MGLQGVDDDLTLLAVIEPEDARAAATYVTRRLGAESEPILEALQLIGYIGHDFFRSKSLPAWRDGLDSELGGQSSNLANEEEEEDQR